MTKKSLRESIQKSIKENILHEKWTDIVPQMASGIGNMARNISGQYSLGGIDKRFKRVADRIGKDWEASAKDIASKADKLSQSKNQMIAKQGHAALKKVDNIEKQMDQAMQLLQRPADEQLANMQNGQGSDDEFAKHESEKEFESWMKNSGVRPENLSKSDRGKYLKQWQQMKILGLNPSQIPLKDMQREIAIAAHRQNMSMSDLNRQLEVGGDGDDSPQLSGGKKAKTKEHIKQLAKQWAKKNPNASDEQKQAFKKQLKQMIKGSAQQQGRSQGQQPDSNAPVPQPQNTIHGEQIPGEANMRQLMAQQAAKREAAQKGALPPAGAPPSPPSPQQVVPGVPKQDVAQGNVVPPRPPLAAPADMQSPPQQKGKASPAHNPAPMQKVHGAPQPSRGGPGTVGPMPAEIEKKKGQAAPPPLPPKRLAPKGFEKPGAAGEELPDEPDNVDKNPPGLQSPKRNKGKASPPPKEVKMEMPPREINPPRLKVRNTPDSIAALMPPIKDDGDEIQVGSEEKPGMSPREDVVLKDKKPKLGGEDAARRARGDNPKKKSKKK